MAVGVTKRERPGIAYRSLSVLDRIWGSVSLRILLVVSTAGLLSWELWGPRLRHAYLYPHFGDLGEWAAAVGSLAAVAVALVQTHLLHLERLDELRRLEEQQRTQVFGWVAYRDDGAGPGGWWVYLNNMTNAPIGVWVLHIEDADTGRKVTLDVTRLLPIVPGFTQRPAGVSPADLLRPMCQLEFSDAVGMCWLRDASGSIRQIPEIRLGDQILAASTAVNGDHRGR
jgi:hypothetical protein